MQIKSIHGRYFAILRRPDGKTNKVSLGTRDAQEAAVIAKEGKLQEMEHAALAGGASLVAALKYAGITSAPVEHALDEYIEELRVAGKAPNTLRSYDITIRNWMMRFDLSRHLVSEVNGSFIYPFVNTTEEISLGTRRLRFTILNLFFEAQMGKGRILRNPCAGIGVQRHELPQKLLIRKVTHVFTEEEYQRLLIAAEQLPPFWHFMLVFGRESALRPVDIASLEIVNIEGENIRLFLRKVGREITLPITPRMRLALESRRPDLKNSYLFPNHVIKAQDPYDRTLQHEFRKLARLAKVTKGSLRSLRKMGAVSEMGDATARLNTLIAGEALRLTAKKLGHTTTKTTEKFYLNQQPNERSSTQS